MYKYIFLFAVLFLTLFGACNSRTKLEKEVDARLEQISRLIEDNNWNTAKNEIDTIHALYPRLVEKRRMAQAYKDTIERREAVKTIAYCDSMLNFKRHEADSLQKMFGFEKNEQYQEHGSFVYKNLIIENNLDRSYLRAEVNETADFFLISHYRGASKIAHNSLKVSTPDDFFAITDSIPELIFKHSFTDDGIRWESVTFKNENASDVGMFIALHQQENIKVKLLGNRSITYQLTPNDRKAITETYKLWVVMSDVVRLKREILKSKAKIEQIKERYTGQHPNTEDRV
ncbi:MAG: hypothetical protein LBH80_01050 [Prevotellaceae bacterium]|jgi:hypothetical protein|nr:hypothetical protein [Prevotellaceae bacterium]